MADKGKKKNKIRDDKAIRNARATRDIDNRHRVINFEDRRSDSDRVKRIRPREKEVYEPVRTKTKSNVRNAQRSTRRVSNIDPRVTSYRDAEEKIARTRRLNTQADYTEDITVRKKSRKQERKVRDARSTTGVSVVAFGVFALVFVYLVGYGYNFISKKIVAYDVVQYGSIDVPKTAEGVIIRAEEVYTTPVSGVVSYSVSENERIKAGTAVCSVSDSAVVGEMQENLDSINENILKLQESREDISFYSEDVKRVNNQIKTLVDTSADKYIKNDISSVYDLKSSIQKKLDVRNQMLLSENKGSLSDLASQKQLQEKELNEKITYLSANTAGIVSYYVDGMEGVYTLENRNSLTKEQTTMKPDSSVGARSNVVANDNVFKILKSNAWYIASYIPSDYIEGWANGDFRTIYVKDSSKESIPLEVQVESITAEGKTSYVVLCVTKYVLDYIDIRAIEFELDKAKIGYKVPNSAIVEETLLKVPSDYISEGTVYKVLGDSVTAINVVISGENKEENVTYVPVMLGTLNVGDTLQKPNEKETTVMISDVISSQGIYIMNTGIAEFSKINLENSVANSTHTVLDPVYNSNINIYDRIVTDTINIEKEQKVYE